MKSVTTLAVSGFIAFMALIISLDTFFIVYENEQAAIVEFGKYIRTVREPGLQIKKPFIQDAIIYDNRLLDHDIPPTEIVTKDKRTLVIDNFAKWRIIDPEQFYKRARTEAVAKDRLRDIIYSELRQDFGAFDLFEIVSTHRDELMKQVTERSNAKAKKLDMGVEIVDVRIKRADLPIENQRAVFRRMSEERKRIAKQFRSEGREEALKIRANTDKDKTILLAEAYKREQELRGHGDAAAIKITAEAYSKDTDFYEFIRSMEAYEKALVKNNKLILSQDSPFLKYLK